MTGRLPPEHPDTTYRFSGTDEAIRAQYRGSASEVATTTELLTDLDTSSTSVTALWPHIATNGKNRQDLFAGSVRTSGGSPNYYDDVELVIIDP